MLDFPEVPYQKYSNKGFLWVVSSKQPRGSFHDQCHTSDNHVQLLSGLLSRQYNFHLNWLFWIWFQSFYPYGFIVLCTDNLLCTQLFCVVLHFCNENLALKVAGVILSVNTSVLYFYPPPAVEHPSYGRTLTTCVQQS